ncbi:NUDIX hydrolase [Lysinibacillus odysseyi]|uniref:Nudix hydrolase domain-containing protein n=1 Tax=Lysinibacillus odysseyi 34hs-1 = NBRC 100172 TaxID=1220589 RepID=A0A0A3IAW7_9BACI|nr:hypothetical protein [Lysinibacillus odysseyi]KGR81844.1 hypothetical protein CD32_21210 [Lysinibacillus odysseyi 34hs-1 = NBRC 100172]
MEKLKIFTEDYKQIGVALRDEAHHFGYWHEVFHCWVIEWIEEEWYIYLQLRSKRKKDYPRQFDITAAGHLLSHEGIEDGIRELQEELGLPTAFCDLHPLGMIPYKIENTSIKDYEFAHVFGYIGKGGFDQFTIQEEELDGIYRLPLEAFLQLVNGTVTAVEMEGYELVHTEKIYDRKGLTLTNMETLPVGYRISFVEKITKWLGEHRY